METSTSTPHLIGGCRIVEKLGQGGMGAVYLAKHQTLGRQVALKLLPQQFTANPEYVQRFLREARAAAQLRHPNIVQVYDAGEQGGQYYISMEFVEGESLAARLKKTGAAPEGQALSWLKQAADGLAAAHKLGLVHRDIKPENLLLEKDGTLKIADFGLVSAVEGEGDSALTQSGAMLGTPLYMSPEQCEGHKADGRSDLYSLGAAFFRVLTGSVAFTAPTPVGVMYKHRYEAPPHPRSINPTLNEPACQVILRLMAKDPAHRFQSAEEVAVSVGALLNDTPTLRPGQLPASYTPAPGGATPLPPGLSPAHTPTMLHAQSPALLNAQTPQPPGVVLGQTSVPTSMTTLAQPPRRNPLAWAAVILLSLGLLGAGGFFGWQMYHEKKIGEFKQKYQDAFSVKQYEDAIRVANAAAAAYPERDEFPAFRDRAEVAWVVDDVARLKAKAETSKKLEKYDEAIDALAAAIKRQEEKRALPGLVPDDTLADLKTWAERKRDERDALAQAGVAEKEERYTDAAALYEKAQGLADTDDARLRARQSANRVNFQHHAGLAALYVKNAQWPEALAEWQAAAKFEHKDVSNEIRTAERRIRHAELLADANRLNASGNLREAAKRFDEAANVAESESEAKGLREQAAQLLQDAAFNENLAKGNAALERRDWKAAQEALQAASLARPGDPSLAPKLAKAAAGAWADQADAEFEKKNWAAAYASYRKAADADPSDKELARKAADAKLLVDRIESTQAAAQQAEGARRWTEAANAWNSLAALDPNEADRYETRSKNAQFEAAMLKAENLRANGKEEEAAQAALNAIPIFPAGAERARAFAESVRRQQVAEEKAEAAQDALNDAVARAVKLVRDGNVPSAVKFLGQVAAANPKSDEIATLYDSLQGVDALERGYEQLEEARLAAAGAIETALKEDDEKKIKAMLAQIDAQKARLDADARKARAAWLARDFRGISAQVAPLREHAQEMGAYYTLLAGDFRGRAAKAADPKFGLTPNVGGGRRGLFGGIGANIPIGADKRKAGVFEGCAANLDHAAATARAAALRR